MKEFVNKLEKEGIKVGTGLDIYNNSFDFTTHIKNDIYSFLCQNQLNDSFARFLILKKKNYFKENPTMIKRFFTGLITFCEKISDVNIKKFYFYILNNDINRKILKSVYNTNHKIMNSSGLKIELKQFYRVEELMPIFKENLMLNDSEFVDFSEKLEKNTFYKQFIGIPFVKLSILEIYLLRDFSWKNKIIVKPEFKHAIKASNFNTDNNLEFKNQKDTNIFEKHKNNFENITSKKKFSCFRFDFSKKTKTKKSKSQNKKIDKKDGKELAALNLINFPRVGSEEKKIKEMHKKNTFEIDFVKNKEFRENENHQKRKYNNRPNYDVINDANVYKGHLKILQNMKK
jgi:hypothetical protein